MNKSEKIKKIISGSQKYTIQNNSYCFLPGNCLPEETAGKGILGKLQGFLKRFGWLYYFLLHLFGPVISSSIFRKLIKQNFAEYINEKAIVLNIGSGPNYFQGKREIINVDVFAFDEVDIVADAAHLPIEDHSVDLVLNIAMLEHVADPSDIVREMKRILKPGGKILAYLPFIVPYHAAPHDFYRWTSQGALKLFSDFSHVETEIGCGPTSGLLYVFEEWLAVLFSFGIKPVHDILFLLFMVLLSPVKLLDFILEKIPFSSTIASGFIIVASNKQNG
jgi:SAM-dependent methyltransferase